MPRFVFSLKGCLASGWARLAVLLIVLAAGVGLLMATASQRENADEAIRPASSLRVSKAVREDSLAEILARRDAIPTHRHPLLGREAPAFELADAQGNVWSLPKRQSVGPVVLVFNSPHRCGCAGRQLAEIEQDWPLFQQLGAEVIAIAYDASEVARQRTQICCGVRFPVLTDPGHEVARAYQVYRRGPDGATVGPLNGTFVIDQAGVIRWVNIGDAAFCRNSALLYQLARVESDSSLAEPAP